MKKLAATGILILTMAIMSITSVAQVRVTGHVFAEVVEAVGATSATNNSIEMQQQSVTNNFEIGEITLSGGAMSTCDVMITASQLQGITGSQATFSAAPAGGSHAGVLDQAGKNVIRLQGQVGDEVLAYSAQYNVVFSYN